MGREKMASPPIKVITTEITVAKTGQSMKNLAMAYGPCFITESTEF
jgi:hypothetical protein